jgi:DNA-binding GntR family transcriptional regulator
MKSVNTDIAYAHIRHQILEGSYGPGAALMTEVLAEEIGVSRTPVRDALRKLEGDGLVVIQPRLGARVKEIDRREYREMCELRLALEAQAAGLAARNRTTADLAEIEARLLEMRRLSRDLVTARLRAPKLRKFAAEDVRFHIAIVAAGQNELMQREILRLHLIQRVTETPLTEMADPSAPREAQLANDARVLAEHEAIYAAISAGDETAAKLAMEHHIENLMEIALQKLDREERERVAQSLIIPELAHRG